MDVYGIPVQVISALLLALGLLVLASLALVARRQRGDPPPLDLEMLRAAARERAQHAAAAQVRAGRAAAAAAQYRAWASAAVAARDVAWHVQETATQAYQEALRVALAGRATSTAVPPDRTVSRAALSAYRRGDISVDQLREVWVRTAGQDPEQAEREQAAERAAQAEREARRGFDRAAAEARRAEHDAWVAEVAARALADEAAFAAAEAHEVLLTAEIHTPRRRSRTSPSRSATFLE